MTEPARLIGLINAAITATLAVLALVDIIDEEVAGALGLALAAWVVVGAEIVRSRVTPIEAPVLTPEQAAKLEIKP